MSERSESSATPRDSIENVRRQTGAMAGQVQAQASDALNTAKESAAKVAEEAKAQGAELLGHAQERAEDLVEDGKAAGAEQASGFAKAIHHAADELEGTSPDIARHVRAAAESLNGISHALRERSAGQLLEDVTDFGRRQPGLFFGAAAIAGFALVRFAKSTAGGKHAPSSRPSARTAPGWTRNGPDETPRPVTMAGATLGGAAAHRQGDAEPGAMPTPRFATPPVTTPPLTTPNLATPNLATPNLATGAGQVGTVPNEKSESPL
ncbi:MAG: hypothetical protein JWR10_2515 [Rubritepida sp.]|nr:hypothetical protein [Rubritepida sp.]